MRGSWVRIPASSPLRRPPPLKIQFSKSRMGIAASGSHDANRSRPPYANNPHKMPWRMMERLVPVDPSHMDDRSHSGKRRKMKHMLRNLLVVLLFAGCIVHAQEKTDRVAVGNVPQAFAAAWAKHDGHQLAMVMSDDVDFVNVGGDWLHGRADFELYHARLLSGRFKESILTPRDTAVRFLKPDVAILHWSWGIEGDRNEDLTPRKPRFGLFMMIV